MKIKFLLKEIDQEIEQRMNEFHRLGSLSKEMLAKNQPPEVIHELYIRMAHILNELRPVEYLVRKKYEDDLLMNKLFDALINLHEQNTSIIHRVLSDECNRGCCP